MHYQVERRCPAPSDALWAVVADVEGWPRHLSIYREVRRLDSGPLTLGSRFRVKQRRLAAGEWVITELVDGQRFTWSNQAPGAHTVASHVVTAEPGGGSRLTLTLDQSGPLAGLVALLLGRTARRYVDLEADGLTAAASG